MLLLTDAQVRQLLDFSEVIDRVESAFAAHGRGETLAAGLTHTESPGGEFHVKTGGLPGVFGAKVNGSFSPAEGSSRPSIRGVIILFDANNGTPLAILDSGAITAVRTAAATAVAAKYLARPDSEVMTIAGCGVQGRAQLEALSMTLPLRTVHAWSRSDQRAADFAEEMSDRLTLNVRPTRDVREATRSSDVIVTCTPATQPLLLSGDLSRGSFAAAVGGDSPHKQELASDLVAASSVVPDVLEQCLLVGELHHAVDAGLMRAEHIYAELGAIVAGLVPGRVSSDEIFVFDSTGTAMQDVAAGISVYERAIRKGMGTEFVFSFTPSKVP